MAASFWAPASIDSEIIVTAVTKPTANATEVRTCFTRSSPRSATRRAPEEIAARQTRGRDVRESRRGAGQHRAVPVVVHTHLDHRLPRHIADGQESGAVR